MTSTSISNKLNLGGIPPKISEQLLKIGKTKTIKTNDLLVSIGGLCQEICFILEGGFVCQYSVQGDTYSTVNFYIHNFQPFVTIPNAFFNNETSSFQIKAVSNALVLCLHKNDLEDLVSSSSDFSQWYHQKIIVALVEEYKAKSDLITHSSLEMYQYFISEKPQIIQQIPSKYIAQYLGISRQHLHRLKKQTIK